jgi:hypothetical protein
VEQLSLDEIRSETIGEYSNLNLDTTIITIPNVDEIPNISFEKIYDNTMIEDNIFNTISWHTGTTDRNAIFDKIFLNYVDKSNLANLEFNPVPYSEVSSNEDRFTNDIYQLEYNDYEMSFNFWGYHWRMDTLENYVSSIDCTQVGTNTQDIPSEVLSYAEDYVNSFPSYTNDDFSQSFDVANTYTTSEGNTLYEIYLDNYCNGIKFDDHHGQYISSDSYGNDLAIAKLGNDICFECVDDNPPQLVMGLLDLYEVTFEDNNTEFISLNQACDIVSNVLTQGSMFNVDTIELLYSYEYVLEDDYYQETDALVDEYNILGMKSYPIWKFSILNSGIGTSPEIYILIDAVTGETNVYK